MKCSLAVAAAALLVTSVNAQTVDEPAGYGINSDCVVRMLFPQLGVNDPTFVDYQIFRANSLTGAPTVNSFPTSSVSLSHQHTTYWYDTQVHELYSAGTPAHYWKRQSYPTQATSWTYVGQVASLHQQYGPVNNVAASVDEYCDKVRVTWSLATGATSYQVLRNGFLIATVSASTEAQCFYNDTSAQGGTTYTYSVKVDGYCNEWTSGGQSGRRLWNTLATPSASATSGCGYVDLSWPTVTGAVSYTIETSDGAGGWTQLASIAAPTHAYHHDTNPVNGSALFPNSTYTYRITAVNTCTSSSPSSSVNGTVLANPGLISPASSQTPLKGGGITLAASVDNPVPTPSYTWFFNGATISNGTGSLGTVSGATTSSLVITNIQLAATGTFRVDASNTCGSTTGSNVSLVVRCGKADLGKAGGLIGPDGVLDNNDFIAFNTLYANGDMRADLGSSGGVPGSDGILDNDDYIAQLTLYFAGCP